MWRFGVVSFILLPSFVAPLARPPVMSSTGKPLKSAAWTAYKRSYLKKDKPDVHINVFRQIQSSFGGAKVLYPGCHRHLSASLVWPEVDYVDSDAKVSDVYEDEKCRAWVTENSEYEKTPIYTFTCADFTQALSKKLASLVANAAAIKTPINLAIGTSIKPSAK